ncbi:MAG: M60 family metallopeptidase, partial [Clostridia bacterium]|nr:M60 family metallopeptidase [Clostridia bacterium]
CPSGWMSNSLNYNGIVTSGGWGNFHEYHHNFQGYGVGNGGEVTNNGMTLVSYALFTKISSKRGMGSYGGQGLGGWNNYTSATWALNDILSLQRGGHPSNGDQGLTLYSVLLHNFGADNYIQAKVQQQKNSYGQNYAGYFRAWEAITHNDMTYYFKDVLKGLSADVASQWHNAEYTSMFVPVSSVYQTGRSYMYDGEKKYFKTMQPYVVPYEDSFTLDLSKYTAPDGQYASGSIVIPDGFTYTIKSIQPERGTVERIDDYNYKFNFSGNDKLSGEIKVTLSITKDDGAFTVDDVDLILELERSHESNKMTLERTTYTYTAETMYADAKTAYESNFAGYTGEPLSWAHTNPTQNCNTDIWLCTPSTIDKFPNADPDKHVAKDNQIEVLKGKLYFEEEGKYRIYLRGRVNCAVFITYTDANGEVQNKSAQVTNGSGSGFYTTNPDTYIDIEIGSETFVSFTEVLIVKVINNNQASYIGLGYGKWQEPLYTMVEKYYDVNGNEVASPDAEGYHHSATVYYDNAGHEVAADVVAAAQPTPPTSASYVNAYRSDYVFPDNSSFKTDYFYTRNYSYTYSEAHDNLTQSFVGDHGCFFDENRTDFRPEYLFDGDLTTSCSSAAIPSAASPWEFTVDLGKVIEANRFVLTGRLNNGAGNQNQTPNSITLLVGESLDNMKEIANFDNGAVSGTTLAFNFETSTFRYYRLTVRKSVQGRFAAIANIQFSNNVPNGTLLTPDNKDTFTYSGNWKGMQTQSTFGHVMVGAANATVSFKFNGTRLALLSSELFGKNFEVTIDGVKVNSVELKAITGGYGASFMTELLENKEHTVVIKCLGEANIDSVVIYK